MTASRTHEQGAAKTWPKKYKAGTPARICRKLEDQLEYVEAGGQAIRTTKLEYQLECVEAGGPARINTKLRPAVICRNLGCVEAGWPARRITTLEDHLKYV